MGKAGPKTLPTAVKIANGTHRIDRHGDPNLEPKPEQLSENPIAPSTLGPVGVEQWNILAPQLRSLGLLTQLDLPALELMCAAYDELAQCNEELSKTPTFYATDKGTLCQHPMVNQRKNLRAEIKRLMACFGMTPSDRAGVQITKPKTTGIQPRKRG